MKLTAGDTVTLMVGTEKVTLKIEDASKGDVVSGRVEKIHTGASYRTGEVYEFKRTELQEVSED